MGRRQKPRGARRRTVPAWPIIVFGAILVVAAVVLLLTRQSGDGGAPQLAVDQRQIDYGYVKFGETRAIEIAVTNTGTGALRFKQKPYIEILEGC